MKPLVSIIMGSTSDLPVMEKACKWLEEQEIPFEVNALSAHRTPDAVETFAKEAKGRGVKVIIAAAGMAAALPVATVGVNGAQNAAILAAEMIALGDEAIAKKIDNWKASLGKKIEKANKELAEIKDYKFKC